MPTKKMTIIVAVALVSLSSTMLPRITDAPSIDYEHLLQAPYQKKRNFVDVVRDNTVASIVSTIGVVMTAVGIYRLVKTPKSDNTSTGTQKQNSAPSAVDTVKNGNTKKVTPAEKVTAAEAAFNRIAKGELLPADAEGLKNKLDAMKTKSTTNSEALVGAADTFINDLEGLKNRTIKARACVAYLKSGTKDAHGTLLDQGIYQVASYNDAVKNISHLDATTSVQSLEALINDITKGIEEARRILAVQSTPQKKIEELENLLKQGMLDGLLSDDVAMIQDAVDQIVNESKNANTLITAAEKAELLCAKLRENDTVVNSLANLKKRTIEAKAQAQQLKDQPISDEVSNHGRYTELEVAKKLADLDSLKSVATLEALIKSITESLDEINKALALEKTEEEEPASDEEQAELEKEELEKQKEEERVRKAELEKQKQKEELAKQKEEERVRKAELEKQKQAELEKEELAERVRKAELEKQKQTELAKQKQTEAPENNSQTLTPTQAVQSKIQPKTPKAKKKEKGDQLEKQSSRGQGSQKDSKGKNGKSKRKK